MIEKSRLCGQLNKQTNKNQKLLGRANILSIVKNINNNKKNYFNIPSHTFTPKKKIDSKFTISRTRIIVKWSHGSKQLGPLRLCITTIQVSLQTWFFKASGIFCSLSQLWVEFLKTLGAMIMHLWISQVGATCIETLALSAAWWNWSASFWWWYQWWWWCIWRKTNWIQNEFTANVLFKSPNKFHKLDFLWVCWNKFVNCLLYWSKFSILHYT